MSETDVFGPIDFLVIQFPTDSTGADSAKALQELLDSGIVRLYDFMVVRKHAGGDFEEVDLTQASGGQLADWARFAGARSGLLGVDDLPDAAGVLDSGTVGAVIVYENTWAVPFVAAARSEGAEAVASSRLSAQDIMDAIDATDAVA